MKNHNYLNMPIGDQGEPAVPSGPAHGTSRRYGDPRWMCRCDVCTDGNSRRAKTARDKRFGQEPPEHGASGYANYGCTCTVCTEGNRQMLADKRNAAGPGVNRRKEWTDAEIKKITAKKDGRRYQKTAYQLAKELGRSVGAVNQQRSMCKVKSATKARAPQR